MNKKCRGFTLIEMVIFIVVIGIIVVSLFTTVSMALRHTSAIHNQTLATVTSNTCMEYLLGKRYTHENGYRFNDNSQACPGGANYSSTNICGDLGINPPGFTTTVNISCTAVNGFSGPQAFKLVDVEVSGHGGAKVQQVMADY